MLYPAITTLPWFAAALTVPKALRAGRNYNGSTIADGGGLLHAWRHESLAGRSSIWIGTVSNKGVISKAREIIAATEIQDAEDPRLFRSRHGTLWLGWAAVQNYGRGDGTWTVRQMLTRVEDGHTTPWPIGFIKPRQVEKNWTPLPDGGTYYDIPAGLAVDPRGHTVRNRAFAYPRGTFSGGTPALPASNGKWITFFHGKTHHPTRGARYYLAAAEIDPSTYQITRISRRPLVWASDDDPVQVCPRDARYNPSVVFPAGLVRQGGSWLVSLGVHDTWDAWLRIPDHQLDLVPLPEALATLSSAVPADTAPPPGASLVRCAIHRLAEPGGPYVRGDHFLTTTTRAHALGNMVDIITTNP